MSMEDVVHQIEHDDVDIDLVHAFMTTHRFPQCFRLEGASLFRVIGRTVGDL